jgi:hypothetical protein
MGVESTDVFGGKIRKPDAAACELVTLATFQLDPVIELQA